MTRVPVGVETRQRVPCGVYATLLAGAGLLTPGPTQVPAGIHGVGARSRCDRGLRRGVSVFGRPREGVPTQDETRSRAGFPRTVDSDPQLRHWVNHIPVSDIVEQLEFE